jgi:hypothetical protein
VRLELNARPCFALLRRGLLFSALAGVSLVSHAAGSFKNATTTGGYTVNWSPGATPNTPTTGTIVPNVGWLPTVSTGPSNVPIVKQSLPLPINNKNVVIDVEAKVKGGPKFSTAVLKFGKVLPFVGNVIAAGELVDFLKDTFDSESLTLKNNNGQLEADIVTKSFQEIGNTEYRYGPNLPWSSSMESACNDLAAFYSTQYPFSLSFVSFTTGGSNCILRMSSNGQTGVWGLLEKKPLVCPAGSQITPTGCIIESGSSRTVTEQEISDKIASASGWPSSAAPLIRKMLQAPGVEVPTDPASTATSGPSSVPGQKTTATESVKLVPGTNTPAAPGATQTDPGTKTTTTTSTTNITYQGDKVIYNTTNNTTTNITNNTTNITTNEGDKTETTEDQTPPEEKEPEDPCKFDPERIGCSKYGDPPEPGELPKKDKEISITPVDMGGPGACPAPIPFSVFGQSYALSYQPACDVAVYLKTLVLLMASVIAGYVFVGGLKS